MQTASSIQELLEQVRIRIVPFSITFFVVVFTTYLLLYIADFYPEPITEETTADVAAAADTAESELLAPESDGEMSPTATTTEESEVAAFDRSPYPVSITFDRLEKTVAVQNPQSRSIAALDAALLEGAVRHPDSADLVNTGNVFILGHSSYLPNVMNKNFQAFNGIQNLQWGDTIRVASADTEYVYRVERVYESPASAVMVPVDGTEAKLTLATCNSFGSKEDRFIIEANLVESVALDAE